MNILAVGANPDDVEILCAGTLAVHAHRGDRIAIAILTTGDKGALDVSPEEMAALREQEARDAAAVIGAALHPLRLPDGAVEVSLALRRRLVSLIRRTAPDVIITHYERDYMSDHCYTSQLVFDASFWAGVAAFAGEPDETSDYSVRPKILAMDTVAGLGFVPEEYVDISGVIDTKLEMLACHKSQISYMQERDGFDMLDYVRTAARYRGYQCGVPYAEGFIPRRVFPSLTAREALA